jgi:transglutaminase-like putative cysteine protease
MKTKNLHMLLVLLNILFSLEAVEFSLRPGVFAYIPSGDTAEYFSSGGGGRLAFDLDVSSILTNPLGLGYTAGLEVGYGYSALAEGVGGSLQTFSFGGSLGLYYFPLPRLHLRLEGAAGVYQGNSPNASSAYYYLRGGAEAGFRFSPAFILSAAAGFSHLGNKPDKGTLAQNIYAGLTLQFNLETGGQQGSVKTGITQDEPVYPVFFSHYREYEAASLTIVNNENAEIRDVRVSFLGSPYTASEYPCGNIPLIPRGRSAEIPLYADFAPELLRFTEDGRIIGDVIIRYRFLSEERQFVQSTAVRVYNRNYFSQYSEDADTSSLAAFVSPTSPEVLEFSKYISGLARNGRRMGLNDNMQNAAWLYEGLKAAGIAIRRESENKIQFPAETLVYRSGEVRDIALLYAASLEAAGIKAAFLPVGDDLIVAVSLDIDQRAAQALFTGNEKIIIVDDSVWLPLSMASLEDGFYAAWHNAADKLQSYFTSDRLVEFTSLRAAWELYPPAPFPAMGVRITQPGMNMVARSADEAMGKYIASEITPLVRKQEQLVQVSPDAANYNRLGILLVRSGRVNDALNAFSRAADRGSVPAMVNLGQLALNTNDEAAAERWYNRALALEPGNTSARAGLQRAQKK